jgi:hypothetical protein
MLHPVPAPAPARPADNRHAGFLAVLPAVHRAARLRFRHVRCDGRRQDLMAEAVALAWLWFARLAARGKDPAAFVTTFARLAARAAACGRRVAGQEPVRDALSWACRRRHGFAVRPLPESPHAPATGLEDALADNTRSPVPAQVQFRADFPAWLARLPVRDRLVVVRLALGHRTSEVAGAVGVTPARVSQLRGQFRRSYLAFLEGPDGR